MNNIDSISVKVIFLQVFTFTVTNSNWKLYDWGKITTIAAFQKPIDPSLVCFAHSKGIRVVYGGKLIIEMILKLK